MPENIQFQACKLVVNSVSPVDSIMPCAVLWYRRRQRLKWSTSPVHALCRRWQPNDPVSIRHSRTCQYWTSSSSVLMLNSLYSLNFPCNILVTSSRGCYTRKTASVEFKESSTPDGSLSCIQTSSIDINLRPTLSLHHLSLSLAACSLITFMTKVWFFHSKLISRLFNPALNPADRTI